MPVIGIQPGKIMKSGPEKILLVDDDPAIRQILLRLLSEEGYFVKTAANAREAAELAGAIPFDLVLLDLSMPEPDGWETFEEISKNNPLLPFILITARSNQLFPSLAAGIGALLEKPLDFTKLFQTIQALLSESETVRLARRAGRTSVFRHIPQQTEPLARIHAR